jgi:hypothetical protein
MAWLAAGGLLAVVATLGCGNQYQPVITPIQPTGPAGQPTAYALVTSEPHYNLLNVPADNPCILSNSTTLSAAAYTDPGVATLIDTSGDSIMNTALIGNGPINMGMDPTGGLAYVPNCDGTMSYVEANTTLQTNKIQTSTFLNSYQGASLFAVPNNVLAMNGTIFVTEKGHNAIAEMSANAPPALVQEIPVAPALINMVGINDAQRIYAISQGNSSSGGNLAWGACSNPSSVTTDGEADGLDLLISTTDKVTSVANQSISSRLPLGVCPVYGVMSSNGERAFIMNRGSGTVTVIDAQKNAIDPTNNGYLTGNGTINLCNGQSPCDAGPVYADIYGNGQLLVTANYDNNTISVIDISQDVYGNDSPTFGKVLATVKVGMHPAALSVLQSDTNPRVYVADQGTITGSGSNATYNDDGAVTIVNLNNYSIIKTMDLDMNPREIASIYNYPVGKVLVTGPNSPFVTVIRTDTDTLDTTIEVQGNITGLRTSTQYAGASTSVLTNNNIIESHAPGSGEP